MRMRDSRSKANQLRGEDQVPAPAAQNENPNQANQTNHRNIAIIAADTTTRLVITICARRLPSGNVFAGVCLSTEEGSFPLCITTCDVPFRGLGVPLLCLWTRGYPSRNNGADGIPLAFTQDYFLVLFCFSISFPKSGFDPVIRGIFQHISVHFSAQ